QAELRYAQRLMQAQGWTCIDVSYKAVEEVAGGLLHRIRGSMAGPRACATSAQAPSSSITRTGRRMRSADVERVLLHGSLIRHSHRRPYAQFSHPRTASHP